MGFHYGIEKRKFDKEWEQLEQESQYQKESAPWESIYSSHSLRSSMSVMPGTITFEACSIVALFKFCIS